MVARGLGLLLVGVLALGGCGRQGGAVSAGPASVAVGLPVLGWFVSRLGPEGLAVSSLLPPGASPHSYEPLPDSVAKTLSARLMIIAGMPFERRLAQRLGARDGGPRVVDLAEGRTLLPGDEGELDLHYWMDPREGVDIARRVAEALKVVFPQEAAAIDGRLAVVVAEIQAVDLELEALLAPHKGEKVFVYHGAYGYLCQRYGLTQVSLGVGGKEAGAAQVHGMMEEAAHNHAHGILVQPQYAGGARSFAGKLEAVAIQSDPLAGDYLEVLRGSAQAMVAALSDHVGTPTAREGAGRSH